VLAAYSIVKCCRDVEVEIILGCFHMILIARCLPTSSKTIVPCQSITQALRLPLPVAITDKVTSRYVRGWHQVRPPRKEKHCLWTLNLQKVWMLLFVLSELSFYGLQGQAATRAGPANILSDPLATCPCSVRGFWAGTANIRRSVAAYRFEQMTFVLVLEGDIQTFVDLCSYWKPNVLPEEYDPTSGRISLAARA